MATVKRNHRNQPVGEAHKDAKLTDRKVLWLRRMKERGMCIRCMAAILGVSYATAWDAANYLTWRHVK